MKNKIDLSPIMENFPEAKSGFKIHKNHIGWCTPMTKSTCTGKRRQFAINAKHHFKKQGEDGLELPEPPAWLKNYREPYPSMPGFNDDNNLAPVTVTAQKNTPMSPITP